MFNQARTTRWAAVAAVGLLLTARGLPADVKLSFVHGGKPLACRIEGLADPETLRVRERTGTRLVKLADIQQIDFGSPVTRDSNGLVIEPIGGSRLHGRILGGDASAFQIQVRGLGRLTMPLDKIRVAANAAVDGGEAGPRALAEVRKTPRDRDTLLFAVRGEIRPFPTLVRKMDAGGVEIQWSGGTRMVGWERIYAIVFAAFADNGAAAAAPARAILTDGSVVAGRILAFSATRLTLAPTFVERIDIAVADVARVEFSSEKLVHLSDQKPSQMKKAGYFGQSWPVRFDVSLTGRPLMLGKVIYKKGIACHSHAAITYDLDGKFKTFAATIGIHDETDGLGNCVFRVTDENGKQLYSSGDQSARDPPRTVSVDVTGVKKLVLVVDFGKDKGVGDNAVWADARVIKP